MADNQFGIQVSVDASGASDGAREFKRSADDISASSKTAGEGVKGLQTQLKGLGQGEVHEALESITSSLELLNTGLRALGIGAVIIEFKELFEVGKQLEDAFIHLQVASGQAASGMDELKAQTVELSNSFGKSQIDVATAQLAVAKAGFKDVADNVEVTTAALELSKTSFSDVGSSTDLLTRVMQTYGASASEANKYQQELFVTTRSGRLDVEQLNQVFGRSAQYIQASGLSFEEVGAALNGLTTSGINVNSHIQGFTQVLRDIAQPTTTAQENFKVLTTTLDAMGVKATSLKQLVGEQGLVGAFQTLVKATGGDQSLLEKVLGNPQAAIVAIDLVNQGVKGYTDTINSYKTAAQQQAEQDEKITASAAYQAEQFRQKVQNAFIGLAGSALEALTPVFTFLNKNFADLQYVADALVVVLSTKLLLALVRAGAEFYSLVTSQIAAAAASRALAATQAEVQAALISSGLAAEEEAIEMTALAAADAEAAEATGLLGTAMSALGGPVGILLELLAGLTIAWIKYHDASGRSKATNTEFNSEIAELKKHDTPENRQLAVGTGDELDDRKTALQDEIAKLQNPLSESSVDPGTLGEIKRRQAAGEKLDPAQQQIANSLKGILSQDDLKKLVEAKSQLAQVNENLEKFGALKGAAADKPLDPNIFKTQGERDEETLQPAKVSGTAAQAVKLQSNGQGGTVIQSEIDQNKDLVTVFTKVGEEAQSLTDIENGLAFARKGGAVQVGIATLKGQELTRAIEELQAKYYSAIDAQNKFNVQLDQAASKYDPIAAQTVAYRQELLKLTEAYGILGRAIDPTVKRQADVANQQKQTTNASKIQESVAPDSAAKSFISTVATQSNNLIQANEYFKENKITLDQLKDAYIAAGLAVDRAAIATKALTTGQLGLANAQQAVKEAEAKANTNGLQGDDRVQFLRESQVAQDDAARNSDKLADRVENLASEYEPLIGIQKKYIDQLDTIASLEKGATPEQKIQLETARTLAPVQQKQQVDKALVLPAFDKTVLQATDTYTKSMADLNYELQAGYIDQNQFNQAALETHEAFLAAEAQFNDFTKAVQDGGKVMGDALEQYLIHPAEGLRGLFESIAKGLQSSAAGLLTKQLESKAYGALQDSSNKSISDFGSNLLHGAGIVRKTPVDPLAQISAKDTSYAQKIAVAPEKDELSAITPTATKLGGPLGSDQLGTAATTLSDAAANLQLAATALQSFVQNGAAGLTPPTGTPGSALSAADNLGYIDTSYANKYRVGDASSGGNALGTDTNSLLNSSSGLGSNFLGVGENAFGAAAKGQDVGKAAESTAASGAVKLGLNLLKSYFGGESALDTAFTNSNISGGGFAGGGDAKAGSSHMVGETGPEVVSFGQNAHVTPNDQVRAAVGAAVGNKQAAQPAPNVSVPVQIVNVSDPDDVPNGMATAKGGKVIQNYLSQNKTAVKAQLGL